MAFRRFKTQFWIRLMGLLIAMLSLSFFLMIKAWYFSSLITFLIIIALGMEFIKFVSSTNKKLTHFFKMVDSEDYAFSFNSKKQGGGFDDLHKALNNLLQKLKEARIDKETQLLFFTEMIHKLNTGVLAINREEEIIISNPSSLELLQIPEDNSWQRTRSRIPLVAEQLDQLQNNEKKLIILKHNGKPQQILTVRRDIKINQKTFSFFTFQNIHDELERKEMESWQKLIRVLTHEIMNSVSPIVSLSSTLDLLLKNKKEEDNNVLIESKTFQDIELSISTIQNRSKGLLEFVDEYSKLTRIPKPKIQTFSLVNCLQELKILVSENIVEHGIQLQINCSNSSGEVHGDSSLLQQVFLNLLLNAIDAVKGISSPRININVFRTPKYTSISFEDNGIGIPKEVEADIFLPFFTTKDSGTGIGLSLSKNIMLAHNGELSFSRIDQGSRFTVKVLNLSD